MTIRSHIYVYIYIYIYIYILAVVQRWLQCLTYKSEYVCMYICIAECTGGCQNGGMCILPELCGCVPGWTGTNCEIGKAIHSYLFGELYNHIIII